MGFSFQITCNTKRVVSSMHVTGLIMHVTRPTQATVVAGCLARLAAQPRPQPAIATAAVKAGQRTVLPMAFCSGLLWLEVVPQG